MTDTGRENVHATIRQFLDDFALQLQGLVSAPDGPRTEISWGGSIHPGEVLPENLGWWTGNRSEQPTGVVAAGTLLETWEELGRGGESESARDTGFSRFALSLEKTLAKQFGPGELAATSGPSEVPPANWTRVTLAIQRSDSRYPPMYCCFSPDLERAFLAAETATRFPSGPFVTGGSPVSMEMLMDVEVPVRISFGRTQIRMKELLSLNSGSLVELDRALGDRVEVLVNRCVIARGEVVAVDGNYGVRIVEIVSRQAVPPVS